MSILTKPIVSSLTTSITKDIFDSSDSVLWTPAQLFQAGEAGAWYDPSDLSTLFIDSAGTTPVTSDGDPVGLILDKSGNGNNLIQSISASRPTYKTDGTLHWLAFDGIDDYLTGGDILDLGLNSATISSGVKMSSVESQCIFAKAQNLGVVGRYALIKSSGSMLTLFSQTVTGLVASASYSTIIDDVITGIIDRSGDLIVRTDGVEIDTLSYTDTSVYMDTSTRCLVGAYNNNNDTGELSFLDGRLYILVVRHAYAADTIIQIESYIANKSGVTL